MMLYILFICLSFLQGAIMRRLGPVWTFRRFAIPAMPLYSAWGIGWVVTIAHLTHTLDYWSLFFYFVVAFPGIIWGSIPPKQTMTTLDKLKSINDVLKDIESHLNKLVWKF